MDNVFLLQVVLNAMLTQIVGNLKFVRIKNVLKIHYAKFYAWKALFARMAHVCLTSPSVPPMPITKQPSVPIPGPTRRPVYLYSTSELPTHFSAEWRRTAHEWTSRESAIPARTAVLCTILINPVTKCPSCATRGTHALIVATAHRHVQWARSVPMTGRSAAVVAVSISARLWNARLVLASSDSASSSRPRVRALWAHHLVVRRISGVVLALNALICVSDRRVLRTKNATRNLEPVRKSQLFID